MGFFEELYDWSQNNCVGGILSNQTKLLSQTQKRVLQFPLHNYTYDWARINTY